MSVSSEGFGVERDGPQGPPGMQAAAERTLGPPQRIYHADGYTILVWHTGLLRRLGPMSS